MLGAEVVRANRPLAASGQTVEKTTKIGDFVILEQSGSRFHIEVAAGVTKKAAKRVARLIWQHTRTHRGAVMTQLIDGRERSFGPVKLLSVAKLTNIILSGRHDKASYVVISEHTGGALSSDFWLHPGLSTVLER